MLIDLDRAIARTSNGKHDELLERAFWRRIQPGSTIIHNIAASIPDSGETIEARSIAGLMCYLSAVSNWATLPESERIEKRIAIVHGAAESHAQQGQAVAIVVDKSVVLSNTDGDTCDCIYDASSDRELIVSLVANRDLKLWERATSYVLRGCPALDSVTNPNCKSCAFFRASGIPESQFFDRWCHADLQTIGKDRGTECSDYYPRALLSRRTSERFVPVRARDIWRRSSDGTEEIIFDVPEAN